MSTQAQIRNAFIEQNPHQHPEVGISDSCAEYALHCIGGEGVNPHFFLSFILSRQATVRNTFVNHNTKKWVFWAYARRGEGG